MPRKTVDVVVVDVDDAQRFNEAAARCRGKRRGTTAPSP